MGAPSISSRRKSTRSATEKAQVLEGLCRTATTRRSTSLSARWIRSQMAQGDGVEGTGIDGNAQRNSRGRWRPQSNAARRAFAGLGRKICGEALDFPNERSPSFRRSPVRRRKPRARSEHRLRPQHRHPPGPGPLRSAPHGHRPQRRLGHERRSPGAPGRGRTARARRAPVPAPGAGRRDRPRCPTCSSTPSTAPAARTGRSRATWSPCTGPTPAPASWPWPPPWTSGSPSASGSPKGCRWCPTGGSPRRRWRKDARCRPARPRGAGPAGVRQAGQPGLQHRHREDPSRRGPARPPWTGPSATTGGCWWSRGCAPGNWKWRCWAGTTRS